MKKLYALTALLLGMTGCSEETITYTNPVPGDEPSGIAAELGISSKNTWFAAEDERNASIGFKSLGGEVVVDIQTNTTWKYDAVNAGWLTIEKDDVADQLVLNCEGNKVEEQQQATITITAGDKTATISAAQNAYGTLEIAASKNNFQIPAVGELTAEFEVQSTDEDWIFETKDCPWLLLEQQGDKVTMTLDPNEEIEDRETTFVLIAGEGGGNPVSETIRVTQDRAVYVNVSLKTIPLSPTPTESDKKELGIRSNYDWEYTLSENSDWLSATKTEQGLTITAETNSSGSSRTATITVSAGDGKQNQTEQVVTVSQTGLDLDAFILGIDITSSSLKTYLPFDKAIDATIDWGDGSIEETVTGLSPDTLQGDAVILDLLHRCGAQFTREGDTVTFAKAPLHGVDIDLADCPDLGPVLMVLGLLCEGTTVIRNAERLRLKESDRIAAMEAELRACGGVLESEGGTITVHGCAEHLHAPEGILHGHNDHRVVMSLAVLSAAAGLPLTVDDAEAIQKSWPNFFAAIRPLGVEVEYA